MTLIIHLISQTQFALLVLKFLSAIALLNWVRPNPTAFIVMLAVLEIAGLQIVQKLFDQRSGVA